MRTLVLALLALTLAGLGAGCGSDNAAETDVTPAAAAAEIDTIKSTLDDALTKYEDGDAKAAEQLVGDAYLEHYEELEHPLEEADKELMEDLEHTLSTEIRAKLKAGAPAAEVKQLIVATKADLDRAKAALQD
jgi:predicted lipid-binding transport protein (Tim44 family)